MPIQNLSSRGGFPILFNRGSFSRTSCFARLLGDILERRMPGKSGEGTPRPVQTLPRARALAPSSWLLLGRGPGALLLQVLSADDPSGFWPFSAASISLGGRQLGVGILPFG